MRGIVTVGALGLTAHGALEAGWVGGRQRWWWCKEGIIVRSHRANHEKKLFREAQNTEMTILLGGVAPPIKLCVQLNPCSPK